MKYFTLTAVIYKLFIRTPLKAAINDPSTEWDNYLIDSLDTIFTYKKGGGDHAQ